MKLEIKDPKAETTWEAFGVMQHRKAVMEARASVIYAEGVLEKKSRVEILADLAAEATSLAEYTILITCYEANKSAFNLAVGFASLLGEEEEQIAFPIAHKIRDEALEILNKLKNT